MVREQANPTAPRSSAASAWAEEAATASVVALVEGPSDAAALTTLAQRHGRNLATEGVLVVPIGGATNIGHHLQVLTGAHPQLRVTGLCDADEERAYRRGLERAGLCVSATRERMKDLGFYVCDQDLEDELIRSLGARAVLEVFDQAGTLEKFHLYQRQPAHRRETLEEQLRGFVTNEKRRYARLFIGALDLHRVPGPLAGLLAHI
ncbi:MAG TPA: TOPRIM nucleotidyl transferase/hydrolase domain-containing protein [Jiangellaceae bacterium]|nr:TOPRIM nucleotidyl transferase/hydrolase domain-containing protein [Jiangellaceae bacterium]